MQRAFHPRVIAAPAAFYLAAVLLLCAAVHAQQPCDSEAKLLLAPAETEAAVGALGAKDETDGRIYFFDTQALDLLAQGVIVRLRRGADNDLTIKLRPLAGQSFSGPSAGHEKYKCEVDVTGTGDIYSYSMTRKYNDASLPATGTELLSMLTPGQKKLLQEAHVGIDWSRVKRIAEIRSAVWSIKSHSQFKKLTLERWQWPGRQVLELSAKVQAAAGKSAYEDLQRLAQAKGLSLSSVQGAKTAVALKQITGSQER